MRPSTTALLTLLSTTTHAFYPYHRNNTNEPLQFLPRAVSKARTKSVAPDLTVPIWKAVGKRANNFNIVSADNPEQAQSAGVDQDGADHAYFISFKIGTSNKNLYMLLDSAASNTWIMSEQCTTAACQQHTLIGTQDSTSLKMQPGTFSVTYGTGSVVGTIGQDTVHFGGMDVPLTFGLAQTVSNEFSSFPMDGILGLGRQDNVVDTTGMINAPSVMEMLFINGVISAKLYAIDLWRASDGGSNTGAVSFGKPDATRYQGDLNYVTAIKNTLGFWELPVNDASVNGNIAGLSGRTAIIDSGTSYILMPRDDALQLHELIRGYEFDGVENFAVPCDTKVKVQLIFGGTTYDIQPADYIGARISSTSNNCASNIVGRQTFGAKQWLVGDVFLKNVYSVFDFDGQRVGFGIKKASGSSTSPSLSGESSNTIPSDVGSSTAVKISSTSTLYMDVTFVPPDLLVTVLVPPVLTPTSVHTTSEPRTLPGSPPSAASTVAQPTSLKPESISTSVESTFLITTLAAGSARPTSSTAPALLPPGAGSTGSQSTLPSSSGTGSADSQSATKAGVATSSTVPRSLLALICVAMGMTTVI